MHEAFVIINVADRTNWADRPSMSERIPPEQRPTVIQFSRTQAEEEAPPAEALPERTLCCSEATHITKMVEIPSHVNLRGDPFLFDNVAVLAKVSDDVPFDFRNSP